MKLAVFPALVLLGLAACGESTTPTISASVNPATFPAGGQTTISVTTTDFTLIDDGAHGLRLDHGDEHASEGHYHVYVDSTDVNPILQSGKAMDQLTVAGSVGAHKLIVRLHDASHLIIEPEVKTELSITLTMP